jgi:hypothetical protein
LINNLLSDKFEDGENSLNQPNVTIPEDLLRQFNGGETIPVVLSVDWHVAAETVVNCSNGRKIIRARVTRVEQAGERSVRVWLYKC